MEPEYENKFFEKRCGLDCAAHKHALPGHTMKNLVTTALGLMENAGHISTVYNYVSEPPPYNPPALLPPSIVWFLVGLSNFDYITLFGTL